MLRQKRSRKVVRIIAAIIEVVVNVIKFVSLQIRCCCWCGSYSKHFKYLKFMIILEFSLLVELNSRRC